MDLSIIPYDDRTQQHLVNSQLPDWLPKHEFLMLIVAPAGSGKTTLLLNMLLRIYKQYWHQIFLFSPTIHNDGKWEHLKKERQVLLPMVDKGLHHQFIQGQGVSGNGKGGDSITNDKDNEQLPEWMKKKPKSGGATNTQDMEYTYPDNYGTNGKKTLSKKSIFSKKHGPPVIHKRPNRTEVDEINRLRKGEELNIEMVKKKYLEYQKRRETLLNQLQKPLTPMELQLWEDLKKQLFKSNQPRSTSQEGHTENEDLEGNHQSKQKTGEKSGSSKKKKDRMVHDNEMFEEYNEETLQTIMEQKDKLVKTTKQNSKSKDNMKWMTQVERSVFVFDDMVGSGLFSNKRQNAFKRLTVRRRHLFSSVIGVTQAYREIPKTTRTNANAIILFHIDNEEELNTIYEEFPMGLKWHQWMAVVEWATQEPYSFIMFNTQQSDPNQRIVKQFTQPLPLDWIKQTFI